MNEIFLNRLDGDLSSQENIIQIFLIELADVRMGCDDLAGVSEDLQKKIL